MNVTSLELVLALFTGFLSRYFISSSIFLTCLTLMPEEIRRPWSFMLDLNVRLW